MSAPPWNTAGFHGKLPARGDFVTRALPEPLVAAMDEWLQDGVADSRDRLGERWRALYLVAPVWHFALDAGVAGPDRVAGLLMPSVDLVGRYFPLMIAGPLAGGATLTEIAFAAAGWRRRAEDAALLALADGATLADVEAAVAALGPPRGETECGPPEPGDGAGTPARAGAVLADRFLRARHAGPLGLWWTDGAEAMAPRMVAGSGLPDPRLFASFLDGGLDRLDALDVTVVLPEPRDG